MSDESALLEAVEKLNTKIGKQFHEFKTANDERLAELEKKGVADPLIKESIAKLQAGMDENLKLKDEIVRVKNAMKGLLANGNGAQGVAMGEDAAEVKAAYRQWLRTGQVKQGNSVRDDSKQFFWDRKDQKVEDVEHKTMSVISDPDGGYTVTADMSGRVIKKVFETSEVRQAAYQQTIGTDALEGLMDLGEAGSGWVGEQASRPSTSTPQLKQYRIPVHELYAFPFASQKLLDDSFVNPEQWLADHIAAKFARDENTAFVTGNGVAKPRGFLTYTAGTGNPGQIPQVSSGSNGLVVSDSLIRWVYGLKTAYSNQAKLAMNRLTLAECRVLKDSQGRYLWDPGLNGPASQSILGKQIMEWADMPVPATDALAIVLADWQQFYTIVDRIGIRILRDPYTNKPFVGFYSTKRVGGDVTNFEAGTIYKLSA